MEIVEVVIKIPKQELERVQSCVVMGLCSTNLTFDIAYRAIANGTVLSAKGRERKFEEIVVEYPNAELCTYPEYRGKPYFSIKYEENGEHIIGFGTYKPEVLSRYLQEYFIAPTSIKADREVDNG